MKDNHQTVWISEFLADPGKFVRMLVGGQLSVIFVIGGANVFQGALVSLETAAFIDDWYRRNINPDWDKPLEFSVAGFRRGRFRYEEDVARNHVVLLTNRGVPKLAWVSNSILLDFEKFLPDMVQSSWPSSHYFQVL